MEQQILDKINNNIVKKFKSLSDVYDETVTPLFLGLCCNKDASLGLSPAEFDYIIKKSNLNLKDSEGFIPLSTMFELNKISDLKITPETFDYAIRNSNLLHSNTIGETPLISALASLAKNEDAFTLSDESWRFLIKNSNLDANINGATPLKIINGYINPLAKILPKDCIEYIFNNTRKDNSDIDNVISYINLLNDTVATRKQLKSNGFRV